MSSSTAKSAAPPPTAAPSTITERASSAFAELDDVMQRRGTFGIVRLSADPKTFAPLMRHFQRRTEQLGRTSWCVGTAATQDAWRQVAVRLGLDLTAESHPRAAAQYIAEAAAHGVLVVAEHQCTRWGSLVRQEIVNLARAVERDLLVILLSPSSQPEARVVGKASKEAEDAAVDIALELGALGQEDLRRWWSAVVFQDAFVQQPNFTELASLDTWWQATRRRPIDDAPPVELSRKASTLRKMLIAAGQGLTAPQWETLSAERFARELTDAGMATLDASGTLRIAEDASLEDGNGRALGRKATGDLVAVLSEVDADGWSCMRAAELAADADAIDQAEELALKAVSIVGDTAAREDLWQRWESVLEGSAKRDPESCLARLLRASEHALDLGDGDRADRMAREAMRIDGDRFDVLLLHGRTSHARGDVTTAALSLTRAMGTAQTSGERARGAGLMAQVRYMAGDPKQAEKYAQAAIDDAADVSTRLDGRNVLGKLLLAKESWREAEEHFAEDAYDAAVADHRAEELRARLNRGIAVLYLGRREQAREMLDEVLRDGEQHGVHTAVAYTLSNLATIAILQHEYQRALQLSERAIEVRRRIGGRIGLVQPITNLAELRLRLGLVDEAEQSLRFGLQACGQGLPLSRYAYFAKLSACIHLERGETAQAAKELATAVSGASCSGDKAQLAQCHRIAARIALEDGDIARARAALASADELRHTAFGQAELEVIRGCVLRAAGESFMDIARQALVLAQQADDPESLREAHVLLCSAYRLEDDEESAASHLRSAQAVVSRVAESLPPSLSKRYLRRPVIIELDHLEADGDVAPTTSRSGAPVPSDHRDGRAPAQKPAAPRRLVGESAPMRALRGTIRRVAGTSATVLITGETGTGKELVAEAIHRASDRRNGPLVKVNCAALVETLLLSELFGHEKGAFTGASSRRRGRFEVAEGGTLFLDEIGDISPRTQVALLRVLQDGTFERVGGCTQLRANVRIVCATHRDLKGMVERGEFREDLYYRLCGVVLEVPALKDRIADLPALSSALLDRAHKTSGIEPRSLSEDALSSLSRHGWPGNVRELENALRVAALFAKGDHIELRDFTDNVEGLRHLTAEAASAPHSARGEWGTIPPPPGDSSPESLPPPSSSTDLVYAEIRSGLKLAEMKKKLEQECIARALVESGGNITRAAKLLGMKRPRLSQLVKQYKLASVLEDIKS